VISLLFVALMGCPSEAPEEGAPVATPAPPGGETPGAIPATPSPNGGAAPGTPPGPPPEGSAGAPPAGAGPTLVQVAPGTGVKVTGTTAFTGTVEGTLRLDVLKKTETMPELVYSTSLKGLGPFEVELPKDLGPAQFTVFIDATGDGPTPGEPMAASGWIDVKTDAVSGVALTLQKFDPTSAPNGASGPPATPPPPGGGGGGGGHGGRGGGGGGGAGAGAGAAPTPG